MSINQEHRAYLLWNVLAAQAKTGNLLTYGELAVQVELHHRALRPPLSLIQDYCLQEKLPPLTLIVVNKGHGRPGKGFIAGAPEDFDEQKQAVFAFPWGSHANPFEYATDEVSAKKIVSYILNPKEDKAALYARVKVRGTVQMLFRTALLEAYNHECCFCGFSLVEGLQAAHIVPWSNSNHANRLNPTNGLLLCANHHALFDKGILTINKQFEIVLDAERKLRSQMDKQMVTSLVGQKIRLPKKPEHYPSPESIQWRNDE